MGRTYWKSPEVFKDCIKWKVGNDIFSRMWKSEMTNKIYLFGTDGRFQQGGNLPKDERPTYEMLNNSLKAFNYSYYEESQWIRGSGTKDKMVFDGALKMFTTN